jgi:hypothetical protein
MLRFYDYIYINFYWLFMRMSKTDTLNFEKPIILMPLLITFNFAVLFVAICGFNSGLPVKPIFVSCFCLLLIIHYFLFIWKKRYRNIELRFSYLSQKQRLLGTVFVIFLWIEGFSIGPFYFIAFRD